MFGPGKYDEQLTQALKACNATQGMLIVFDGKEGPSFCSQVVMDILICLPEILRDLASRVEQDYERSSDLM